MQHSIFCVSIAFPHLRRLIVLRIACMRIRYWVFGRGVFIWELHPLLPGEQLVLWAKLNSAKFLCQYEAWALSEIFIQWKFCAIRYIIVTCSSKIFASTRAMDNGKPDNDNYSYNIIHSHDRIGQEWPVTMVIVYKSVVEALQYNIQMKATKISQWHLYGNALIYSLATIITYSMQAYTVVVPREYSGTPIFQIIWEKHSDEGYGWQFAHAWAFPIVNNEVYQS